MYVLQCINHKEKSKFLILIHNEYFFLDVKGVDQAADDKCVCWPIDIVCMLCFTYLGINISILEYISWGRHLAVFKIYDLTIKCVLTECFVHAINLSPKTNKADGAGLRGCGISYDKEALRATFAAFVKIVATHSLTH